MATNATPVSHKPRLYQNYPNCSYLLPADDEEIERLHLQHKIIKFAFGEKTLFVPFERDTSYLVLDSGCGCGSWILDVAPQFSPSTIVHGIDIEARIFPPTRPLNLSFSVTSITNLPTAWANRFDFINQRVLVAALRRAEWSLALAEMFRVLVSGGWIQLTEVGVPIAGPVTAKYFDMLGAFFHSRGMNLHISKELPSLVQQANFTKIKTEKSHVPLGEWAGQIGKETRDCFMSAFRGMKTPILQEGGLGFTKTENDYDEYMDAMEKEWDKTEGADLEIFTICAQKA